MTTINFDMKQICRVCMRSDQELFPIYDNLYAVEDVTAAMMLEECAACKVESFDELPQQICSNCLVAVRQAYHFKKECERSYSVLMELVYSKNLKETKSLCSSEGSKCKKFEKNLFSHTHLEKYTQTDDKSLYPCERCEQKFFTSEALKLHREDEHRGSAIVCRFCSKSFNRVGYLKTHLAVFHPETGYTSHNQCQICKRQFTRREHMRRHLAVIHKIVELVDEEELVQENDVLKESDARTLKQQIFTLENDVLKEVNAEERTKVLFKSELDDSSSEKSQFEALKASQSPLATNNDDEDEKPLALLFNSTPTNGCFTEVLLEANDSCGEHLSENTEITVKSDLSPECETMLCVNNTAKIQREIKLPKRGRGRPPGRGKTTKSYLKATEGQLNLLRKSSSQSCGCKICCKFFTTVSELKNHMNISHTASRIIKCEDCDNIFTHSSQHKRHRETKHGERKHTCSLCQKSFSTKIYLQRHLTIHGRKRFICKECSKDFVSKDELIAHIKRENHDKPLLCPECGLRCKTSNILMVHLRRHNGEKPYKCKFCSKGFPRTDDLRVHEKYHTGEKSHFCETCGKGFQRKYNLTIHLRVHTGEKPYKCPHCPQAFAQGNDLKAHIRRHTGERFCCELCGAAFLQGYQIRQHKWTEHGIKEDPPTQRVAKFTSPEEQEQQIYKNLQKQLSKSICNHEVQKYANSSFEEVQTSGTINAIINETLTSHLINI